MRTTLKRGIGRGAALNGKNGHNGHVVLPPVAPSTVVRYTSEPPKRRRGRWFSRVLVGLLLTVVALALGIAGGALLYVQKTFQAVQPTSIDVKKARKFLIPVKPGQATIALVVGYDQRAGTEFSDISRSDTVMMIRADPQTNTISLLSIPRDLGVPIYCPKQASSLGTQKINQAYADCGARGTLDTVQHFSSLPITYLITVNFHGFKEIVDKLGGIWMDVDRRYYHVNNGASDQNYANINIHPGYQQLTGEQALDFVRYRHTDDDYHRIARQQEFVRALKQQLAHVSITKYPSIVTTLAHSIQVGSPGTGSLSIKTMVNWAYFALTLPGGHFFQDKIAGVTGDSVTFTDPANITAAITAFTHPDVAVSKAANNAALGIKAKPKVKAPAPDKTAVLVLNGNGVGGSAADGSYLLGQKGYLTVLPPGGALPNAPAHSFHTEIYYDTRQAGSLLAAEALGKLIIPSDVAPLPKDPKLRALDPGAMLVVVLGQTFHNQIQTTPTPTSTPVVHQVPNVRFDTTTGLAMVQPYEHRVPFTLEVPTVLERYSEPDTGGGDDAERLYWMDKGKKQKALRLVFRTSVGEYWGIEETNMPDPPILRDKSFQRKINGRTFSLYYSGQSLQMVVLRVHDKSYWVVNTLLDSLSNETMLHIAQGLKPLTGSK